MSYIVIIDNGLDYSDHTHWTACTCRDEATANKAVAAFMEWRDCAIAAGIDDMEWAREKAWHDANPCPLARGQYFSRLKSYTASCIEVPEWAEGRP